MLTILNQVKNDFQISNRPFFFVVTVFEYIQVLWYTIVIAEDDSKNASGLEMPSWRDVQSYSVWPPYQVIERYYPFKNSSIEDFTIGVENCEHRLNGYCNGPLKPGTTYRVKIRAFTAPDKFTDTEYSFPIQTGKI